MTACVVSSGPKTSAEGIDMNAKTAAVIGSDARHVAAGMVQQTAPLDVSQFKLRF